MFCRKRKTPTAGSNQVVESRGDTVSPSTESIREVGPAEREEDASSLPQKPIHLDENVQFTVYRPRTVAPGTWYAMLAFAHLSQGREGEEEQDPLAEVVRQAQKTLEEKIDRYQDIRADSAYAVPREGQITFVPIVPGITFNPPTSTFVWVEAVHKVEFRLMANSSLDGQTARGRLTVFLGSIILAEITLTVRVDHAFRSTTSKEDLKREPPGRPYRTIFASYSHNDAAIVEEMERRVQQSALGDQYLIDCRNLRAGEKWSEALLKLIDRADLFQLFWSKNSMGSPFVRQEWEHALSLGRPHFVRPVYWEDPLPCTLDGTLPPPQLRELHFQRVPFEEGIGRASPTPSQPDADIWGQRLRADVAEGGRSQTVPIAASRESRRDTPLAPSSGRQDGTVPSRQHVSIAGDKASAILAEPNTDYETVRRLAATKNQLARDVGWRKVEWKYVRWTMYVFDVNARGIARTYFERKDALTGTHSLDTPTVNLMFGEDPLGQAARLDQGNQVTFKARLKALTSREGVGALDIDLDDVQVQDGGGNELVSIPGGRFLMGLPQGSNSLLGLENPQHEVQVADFCLGRYPVTNEEYWWFLEANPSVLKPAFWEDPKFNQPRQPVVGVSFDDACAYCEWAGLRLPSEAEWEYACRANTTTRFSSGDAESDLARVGWYRMNSNGRTQSVGEKAPNGFGLFDMHGNVFEWVEDDHHGHYGGAPTDGSAWVDQPRSKRRVVRGGCWSTDAEPCRTTARTNSPPDRHRNFLGFRVARTRDSH